MRKIFAIIAFILLFAAIPATNNAQSFDYGPRFGLYMEDTDLFIGAQADIELLSVVGIHVVPYIDYIFDSKYDTKWLIGVNALYDIFTLPMGSLYAGGGIGFLRTSYDITNIGTGLITNEKETDSVISLLGGIRFDVTGRFKPFANARISINGDTNIVLEGGLHFSIY